MKKLKLVLASIIRLVAITGIILFTYLVADISVGTVLFIVGSILLLTVFIMALIGLAKGKSRVFKKSGRFNFVLLLTETVLAMLILLVTFSVTTLVQEEVGLLSAQDKIGIVRNVFSLSEKEVTDFTQEYPVLEKDNVTFRYHPNTEESVKKWQIVSKLLKIWKKTSMEKSLIKVNHSRLSS